MLRSIFILLLIWQFSFLLAAQPDTLWSCRPGAAVRLSAPAGQSAYQWEPAVTLTNPTIPDPIVRPLSTTRFVVRSILNADGENLFQNPDFEAGSTGFISDYPSVTAINTQGVYGISANPASLNSTFFTACSDNTTGSTNMMVVDGSPAPNAKVWCQMVAVRPNVDYALSAWLTSVNAPNPARLQFSINGGGIGSVLRAGETVCDWRQFYAVWNAGANTSAEVCVVNQNTNPQGNDFALDDFSFRELISTRQDTVVVVVASLEPKVEVRRSTDCGAENGILEVSLANAQRDVFFTLATGTPQSSGTFTGLSAGTYEISVRAVGGTTLDSNECVVSITANLPSRTCPIYLPSAFSPNSDGINDVFRLGIHPESSLLTGQLSVYDRWGGLVFRGEELPVAAIAWDGMGTKKAAAPGTYVYQLVLADRAGVITTRKGTILLIH
ncbi:MAG: gliding motility-associated C-terminal domain-containing protein [Bacteroidota bacterium]